MSSRSDTNKRDFDAMAAQQEQEQEESPSSGSIQDDHSSDDFEDSSDNSEESEVEGVYQEFYLHDSTNVDKDILQLLVANENHVPTKVIERVSILGIGDDGVAHFASIAQALEQNTTVRTVWFNLDYKIHGAVPAAACKAIQSLVTNSTTIQNMHFRVVDGSSSFYRGAEMLTDAVVDGLATTKIHTIGTLGVDEKKYKKVCQAMERNPHLRSVQVGFWGDPFILKMLTRIKERGWMELWKSSCDEGAPDWNILEEAVSDCQRSIRYYPRDSDWHEPVDPAFVLYQFVRARPDAIRPLVEQKVDCCTSEDNSTQNETDRVKV